ncbi:hypothetical protein RYX36_012951, partial [Vicia faba]
LSAINLFNNQHQQRLQTTITQQSKHSLYFPSSSISPIHRQPPLHHHRFSFNCIITVTSPYSASISSPPLFNFRNPPWPQPQNNAFVSAYASSSSFVSQPQPQRPQLQCRGRNSSTQSYSSRDSALFEKPTYGTIGPNGRNFNINQYQLGILKCDAEWNNDTSFVYTLDPFNRTCQKLHFDVGILRPNWFEGANYLGQEYADNFLCNVWEKVDFIHYYEDVVTRRPVKWIFYDGMVAHVMTFEASTLHFFLFFC